MIKEKSKERDQVTEIPEFTLKVRIQIISYYLDGVGNRRNKDEYEKRNTVHFANLRTIFQFTEKTMLI